MKKVISILSLVAFAVSAFAQQGADYKPLISQGEIPIEIISTTSDKYNKDLELIKEAELSRKARKAEKKYSIETNYVLDRFLQSGGALFNDKITNYLNQVAQKLVQNEDKAIRDKIKVYTLRSTAVNAFATSRGDVFVTLGLLAKLDNESQLAFILSHELTHVIKDHNLELYYQSEGISKNSNRKTIARNSGSDDLFLKRSMYSKELELEADKDGFDRFLAAGFDVKQIMSVFDILKYAEHPFCDDKFDYSVLESGSYKIKKKYTKFEADEREGEDQDEDDSNATHPNLSTRKDIIDEKIENLKTEPASITTVNPSLLKEVIRLAQMEIPMLHLHKGQLGLTVYTASTLLKKNPNSLYLKKCIGKALYLDAKYENSGNYSQNDVTDDITGSVQSVYNFMSKMKSKETNALMLNYNYRLYKDNPKDEEIRLVMEDAALEAVTHVGKLVTFTRNEKDVGLYWKRSLLDYKKESKLKKLFANALQEKEEIEEDEENYSKKKKKGYRLGIDKIVIVNPQYISVDARHNEFDVKFINSEEGRLKIGDYIDIAADKNDLKTTILDVKKLKKNEVEAFNDLRFLNEWFSEQGDYNELTPTPGLNQTKMNEISKKYGTRYFLWTGVISARVPNANYLWILPSAFFPPALPFATYAAVKPKYNMLYYSMIFDIETGRREVLGMDYFKKKDSESMMKAHLYDTFLQIKTKPKKSKKKDKKEVAVNAVETSDIVEEDDK